VLLRRIVIVDVVDDVADKIRVQVKINLHLLQNVTFFFASLNNGAKSY